jgi:lysophospholipase L1-like esterase
MLQTGFPTLEQSSQVDLERWFSTYGQFKSFPSRRVFTVANPTTGPGDLINAFIIDIKEMVYAKSLILSCSKNAELNILITPRTTLNGYGNYTGGSINTTVRSFESVAIPLDTLIVGDLVQVTVYVREVYNDDGTVNSSSRAVTCSNTLLGYSTYSDTNFNAEGKILALGDSIMKGYSGPSKKDKHFLWTTKQKLQVDELFQIINFSESGSTSQFVRDLISLGRLDAVKGVRMIVENHGTNDVALGITVNNFTAYLDELIAYKKKYHPDAILLLLGSSPAQNATAQSNANTFRNLKQTKALEANDPKVVYLNLGDSFTATDFSYYISTDTPGSAVHPGDTGSAAITTIINNFITTNNIKI